MMEIPNNYTQPATTAIRRCFAVIACIAALNCYVRTDYNLPLFLFANLFWDF